jgi:protein-disulfide isomerase
MAALAAHAQGKFWEMHNTLFENMRKLDRADLDSYAKQIGLNMGKYTAYMDGNEGEAQIKADQAQAAAIGARGTPAFFVNGRSLSGAQPFERFKDLIDEELKSLGKRKK